MPPGTGGSDWGPEIDCEFAGDQLRPVEDLLARIENLDPDVIVDLGCGSGKLTRTLAERWPQAHVIGLDHSPRMLAAARDGGGRVDWVDGDIADWRPEIAPDLIFSNVVLQGLDKHACLLPDLFALLAPGGVLAVQMPMSQGERAHVLMRDVLGHSGARGARLGSIELGETLARLWVSEPKDYFEALIDGAAELQVWSTEYVQRLRGEEPVFRWMETTALAPIIEALEGAMLERFLTHYRRRLLEAYPRRPDGTTLFSFRRLFLVARAVDVEPAEKVG